MLTDDWRNGITCEKPVDYSYQRYLFIKKMHESNEEGLSINTWSKDDMPDLPQIITEFLKIEAIEFSGNVVKLTTKGREEIDNELFFDYWSGYQKPIPTTKVGVLATGTNVQRWSGIFRELAEKYDRKTIAIDMEAAAIGFLGEFNEKKFIIAKGVGAFAEDEKRFDDRYKAYACYISYRFIVAFFNSLAKSEE